MRRTRTAHRSRFSPVRSNPFGDIKMIVAMSARSRLCFISTVNHELSRAGGPRSQTGNPIDRVGGQLVVVKVVHHDPNAAELDLESTTSSLVQLLPPIVIRRAAARPVQDPRHCPR